ncbi:STAS-like domain-containing protein [Bacillus cereus]|uniref:STAS-like domain-containing protein n=1 Tax=Bacillus cereus TaxID=1396 RepID=UPI0037ED30DC|nr:STAS-like domain-containing protein [Bacillus cereus]MCU9578735.1 STAS-like domain-containing protein [Bacillus cereus]
MVTINVLDHVERCYSNDDGYTILNEVKKAFLSNQKVTLSFIGATSATSSFVNSALIELLEDYSFDYIRSNLQFVNTNKQINDIIKSRFRFETNKKKEALSV